MKLSDLLDIGELRGLCESFTQITGAVTAVLDLEGNVLVATGWQDICTQFHRANPMTCARCRESDTVLAGQLKKGEPYNVYQCKNGLVDVAVPIHIADEHVANFFTGQFFFTPPDRSYFLRQAKEFGFDEKAYLGAMERAPIFSAEQVQSMMGFFLRLAQVMGQMGLAKLRLQQANAKLQASAAIIASSEDAIIGKSLDGIIESWNPGAEKILGYTSSEAIGHPVKMLIPPDRTEEESEIIGRIKRGERLTHFETLCRRKDGLLIDVSASISPILDGGGNVIGAAEIARDITERKQIEIELEKHRHHLEELVATRTDELMQAKDAAEAGNRAKTIFLANMSHELRTPMNGVIGMINLALSRATDPKQVDWLNKSKDSALRMLNVVNDILNFSKAEADRLPLEEKSFTVSQLIDDAISMHDLEAHAKGLRLVSEISPAIPEQLSGDAFHLRQILLNFLGNACKFSKQGTITVRVDSVEQDDDRVLLRLEVEDQGIGISPEQQARLFQAFTQVDDSMTRQYGGSGLGLAIAKRLANLMGGDVGLVSEEGRGSTFWATARLKRVGV